MDLIIAPFTDNTVIKLYFIITIISAVCIGFSILVKSELYSYYYNRTIFSVSKRSLNIDCFYLLIAISYRSFRACNNIISLIVFSIFMILSFYIIRIVLFYILTLIFEFSFAHIKECHESMLCTKNEYIGYLEDSIQQLLHSKLPIYNIYTNIIIVNNKHKAMLKEYDECKSIKEPYELIVMKDRINHYNYLKKFLIHHFDSYMEYEANKEYLTEKISNYMSQDDYNDITPQDYIDKLINDVKQIKEN